MKKLILKRILNAFFKHVKSKLAKKPIAVPEINYMKVQETCLPNHFSWLKAINEKVYI